MYLTGFADEAGADIDTQIKATRELGWSYIESRNIDGKNIHDIPEETFEEVCGKLADAGIGINCFGSAIANWGKEVSEPFDSSLEETRRAIPRMQKLGTKLVRIMSFKWWPDKPKDDQTQMFDERCRRLRELVKMFTDAGIQPVHENCMNYGGLGYTFTLKLLEQVPGLKLVFDTGNPVFSKDFTKNCDPPVAQSSWEFYYKVREHVAYLHIKDGRHDYDAGKLIFTHAGQGQGDVRAVVKDLLDNGYEGGISMEPPLAVVFHDESIQSEDSVRYDNYVEYGRRFEQLLKDIGHGDKINSTTP